METVKRLITFLIFLTLLIAMMSCKSGYHLKRAAKFERKKQEQLAKAIEKGAKVKSDTVFKEIIVKVPEVRVDTVVKNVSFTDTIIVTKDKVITKVKVDVQEKTVYVETKCPEIIKTVKVPVRVETQIQARQNWKTMEVIGWCFLLFILGGVTVYLLKMFRVIP
jgi:hypothetical protein